MQAEPGLIQAFAGMEYYISTKMDDSSHSVGIDENGFHVTGHNFEYKDDGKSPFYEYIKAAGLQEKMKNRIWMTGRWRSGFWRTRRWRNG